MTKYDKIVSEVNRILSQYSYPLTLRQVFYRLVAAEKIDNTLSSYTGLSRMLVTARENKDVDETRFVDRGRYTVEDKFALENPTKLYDLMDSYVRYLGNKYSRNRWLNQDCYLEVWLEKDALSTLISRIATDKYGVPVAVDKGFSSYSHIVTGVKRMACFDGKSTILYFGDFDPSGEDMVRDLQKRLTKYGANAEVVKVALTKDQIRQYDLPPQFVKKSDTKSPKFIAEHGERSAVELDALEPSILEGMVTTAIESRIDKDRWAETEKQTQADKAGIRAKIAAIQSILQET